MRARWSGGGWSELVVAARLGEDADGVGVGVTQVAKDERGKCELVRKMDG